MKWRFVLCCQGVGEWDWPMVSLYLFDKGIERRFVFSTCSRNPGVISIVYHFSLLYRMRFPSLYGMPFTRAADICAREFAREYAFSLALPGAL
jgi:hypothetical protein